MQTKEFYNHIIKVFDDGHVQLARINDKISSVESSMGKKYISSHEYAELKAKRRELIAIEKGIKEKMRQSIREKASETKDALTRETELKKFDGSSITEDVKFFSSGVKMSNNDVITIMRRNSDNLVMLNLAMEYLNNENKIDYNKALEIESEFPVLKSYNESVRSVDYASNMCITILNSYPPVKSNQNTNDPIEPELFTKYINTGSEICNSLCGDQ